jgi:ribonuclease-3
MSRIRSLEDSKQHEKNIYNANNRLLTKEDLFSILDKSGMDYSKIKTKLEDNLEEFQTGFNHKSYCIYNIKISDELKEESKSWNIPLQKTSNERYEFLGDSVLDLIIANYLFDRFPQEKEGFMSKLKTKLVCTKALAKLSSYLGLTKYIMMSKYVEDMCDGRENVKLLENCFESFIGVLWKLFDYETCQDFVLSLIENPDLVDISDLIENDDNFKDQLLRYSHKNFEGRNPVYKELKVEGLSNHAIFTMCVLIPITVDKLIMLGIAKGPNKKEAEQESAKIALKKLITNDLTPLVFKEL